MKRRRILHIFTIIIALSGMLAAALALWTAKTEPYAHYTPGYPQADLLPILEKDMLTDEDYAILFCQAGLAKPGVDVLWESGRQLELLGLQERFFAEAKVECLHSSMFVRSERLLDWMADTESCYFLPAAETGDILVTFNGHIFGWRSGHAAIIVDAQKHLTLEAIMPGCDSQICSLDDWQEYPGFALLRLKDASPEERERIAAYAQKYLISLPYQLAVFSAFDNRSLPSNAKINGIMIKAECQTHHARNAGFDVGDIEGMDISGFNPPPLTGTQCAHLVWYAYNHFGYDLDSDGGFVVTPDDLYESSLLEVVQIYGIAPNS